MFSHLPSELTRFLLSSCFIAVTLCHHADIQFHLDSYRVLFVRA